MRKQNIMIIYRKKYIGIIGLVILTIVLNSLWIAVYNFDKTPLVAIDDLVIFNLVIGFIVSKKVPLASAFLTGMSLTLVFLGYMLIKALISFK